MRLPIDPQDSDGFCSVRSRGRRARASAGAPGGRGPALARARISPVVEKARAYERQHPAMERARGDTISASSTAERPPVIQESVDENEQPASKRRKRVEDRSHSVVDAATSSPVPSETAGALLACDREVSGRLRKEIFGLLHRAGAALDSSFALTGMRIDGAPNVLFITCCENQPQSSSSTVSAATKPSSSSHPSCNGKVKVGVEALIEHVLLTIGRAELDRPASPALLRLSPVQMRVQPGCLDVRHAFASLHTPTSYDQHCIVTLSEGSSSLRMCTACIVFFSSPHCLR